jgi:rhodanese-related sulfurtransferase
MNKAVIIFIIAAFLVLVITSGKLMAQKQGYKQISQAQAKEIMDTRSDYILLDVRTEKEFAAGHIKGAILIPDYEIRLRAEKELPNKAKTILVYCRSGRRSKLAARDLAELGYSDVLEFGGIIDWKYGIEK